MNARLAALLCGLLVADGVLAQASGAEGFGGLGAPAPGFATPRPGTPLVFPKDHGAHDSFRTEWWYVTANLVGDDGAAYGAQWTLFRHALEPQPTRVGWADRNVWMAHAAVTGARTHVFAQTLGRGGVGQAGVAAAPFRAFLDDWALETRDPAPDGGLRRLRASAHGAGFAYRLDLTSDAPLVLQGEGGYSRKSDEGQASYYYSQPFFTVEGEITLAGRTHQVTGRAWMDREWSSQALGADQRGWDWFSLHLSGGEKLMLFRLRGARAYLSGNWIDADGRTRLLAPGDIALTPREETAVAGRRLPTRWRVQVRSRGLDIETSALNAQSWMGTDFPYWEGPIRISGSHVGEGYLEMTGY